MRPCRPSLHGRPHPGTHCPSPVGDPPPRVCRVGRGSPCRPLSGRREDTRTGIRSESFVVPNRSLVQVDSNLSGLNSEPGPLPFLLGSPVLSRVLVSSYDPVSSRTPTLTLGPGREMGLGVPDPVVDNGVVRGTTLPRAPTGVVTVGVVRTPQVPGLGTRVVES